MTDITPDKSKRERRGEVGTESQPVRHLPHWRQTGTTYFVTFRQDDSIPASILAEWADVRARWYRAHELDPGWLKSAPDRFAAASFLSSLFLSDRDCEGVLACCHVPVFTKIQSFQKLPDARLARVECNAAVFGRGRSPELGSRLGRPSCCSLRGPVFTSCFGDEIRTRRVTYPDHRQ
jgi:hypothetical protein